MIEGLVVGVVSGVISGVLVALFLAALKLLRHDRLELIHVSPERAELINFGWRPVVIGGTWRPGEGELLFRPDGYRGGTSGFYIPAFKSITLGTAYFTPGQIMDITYKQVWWTIGKRGEARRAGLENLNCDPAKYVAGGELPKGWKLKQVLYQGYKSW
ncbi:hypothetical protein V5S56_04450 [Corynebacterium propinquum]|uniref:hypothetical protein n=1 Tax=Corynebacterium propinquum TaxID=43769 RepID=UPI0030803E33